MATKNGIDHAMAASATGGAGKGVVGAPAPKPGYTGVPVRVAIFFDGTLNNRTNTRKRLDNPHSNILALKGTDSSYGNFLSNVAIMELLNTLREAADHEVSVYVEGIGTNNFVPGAPKLDKKGKPVLNKQGQPVKLTDAENGNDESIGYALGSGPSGIVGKVNRGFDQLKTSIAQAYRPGNKGKEYVTKLIVDVVGFSRGAAAARHFVHRRKKLQEGWLDQDPPELEINFVGIYDTVSSYESIKGVGGEASMYLASLGWVPGPLNIPIPLNPHKFSTDKIFGDDVLQLGLDLGKVPKRVVHLTAQDEYRENFSLTNINTSLKARVGLELSLPGAHSDIGGGYTEGDPKNPKRELNKEVRRIHDAAEKRQLIRDGWYLPHQFEPWRQYRTPAVPSVPVPVPMPFPLPPVILRTPAVKSYPINIWENGVRFLTHEYQFVALTLMIKFATKAGKHKPMSFKAATGNEARYQVPGRLMPIYNHFYSEAQRLDQQDHSHRKQGDVSLPTITCQTADLTRKLRNQYLHRSARLFTEPKFGMAGRVDVGRGGHYRLVIPDDVYTEKTQDTARRVTKAQAAKGKATVLNKLDQLKGQANRAMQLLKEGAKRGLEEMGKYPPPMLPPF